MHVYRWDLDKTYLDTDIHSVRGMIRSALESASQKRNVPGAAELLRGLIRHDPSCRVTVLSGSPKQMRSVLSRKLQLDGVRFERLVLKDNLGNIRRGRFRAVRDQVGYKLPRLLRMRAEEPSTPQTETLFGDDSEADALIYAMYDNALSGHLESAELRAVMNAAGAYPDAIDDAVDAMSLLQKRPPESPHDIFIHCERGVPISTFRLLGPRIIPVFSWFQAALVLACRGRLDGTGVVAVAQSACGDNSQALAALTQDLVRRGVVDPLAVRTLFQENAPLNTHAPLVGTLLDLWGGRTRTPPTATSPRWLEFMNANEAIAPR